MSFLDSLLEGLTFAVTVSAGPDLDDDVNSTGTLYKLRSSRFLLSAYLLDAIAWLFSQLVAQDAKAGASCLGISYILVGGKNSSLSLSSFL